MLPSEVNRLALETLLGVHVSIASILLRLLVGTVFIVHGYPKLKSGGKGAGEWLKGMGIPAGFGLFAGIVEFFGGIVLLVGLLTPVIAVLSALWMLSTTWLAVAKMKKKFGGGWELDFILLVAALALAVLGGGVISVDHLLRI